eukprot:1159235-Pelagomonas_calceolata.AAC.18
MESEFLPDEVKPTLRGSSWATRRAVVLVHPRWHSHQNCAATSTKKCDDGMPFFPPNAQLFLVQDFTAWSVYPFPSTTYRPKNQG